MNLDKLKSGIPKPMHAADVLGIAGYILRGYGHDDRIVYGSGAVVRTEMIGDYASELLRRPRSPKSTCVRPATIAINAGLNVWTRICEITGNPVAAS